MPILLPFEESLSEEITDICAIGANPHNGLVALILRSKIIIKDSFSPNYQVVTEYQRNEFLVDRYGLCSWVQWINDQYLAYGTKNGTIFISAFDTVIHDPLVSLVNSDVACVCSLNEYLVIFTSKSEMIIMDEKAIYSRINIGENQTGVSSVFFAPPSTFFAVVEEKPAIIPFTKYSLLNGHSPIIQHIPYENVLYISFSIETNQLAMSLKDGSSIIYNLSNNNSTEVSPPTSEKVLFFRIVRNTLIIIFDSGRVLLKSIVSALSHECTIPWLSKCTSFDFSKQITSLFASDGEKFHVLDFFQSRNLSHWSPHKWGVFIKMSDNFPVPDQLYPISGIAESNGFVSIWSRNGIQIGSSFVPLPNITQSIFCNEFLFVFARVERKSHMFIFSVKHPQGALVDFRFPHGVKTAHSFVDQLIVSSPNHFSVITLKKGSGDHQIDSNFYFSISTTPATTPLRDAFLVWPDEVVVWFNNGKVKNFTNNRIIIDDATDLWFCETPPVLFMNCLDGVVISYKDEAVQYDKGALFTNGCDFYFPEEKSEIGKIQYFGRHFAPEFLRKSLNKVTPFTMLSATISGSPDFPKLLAIGLEESMRLGGSDIFIMYLESVPPQLRAQVMDCLVNLLGENIERIKSLPRVRWNEFIKMMKFGPKIMPIISQRPAQPIAVK